MVWTTGRVTGDTIARSGGQSRTRALQRSSANDAINGQAGISVGAADTNGTA